MAIVYAGIPALILILGAISICLWLKNRKKIKISEIYDVENGQGISKDIGNQRMNVMESYEEDAGKIGDFRL